ncbi:hypothetical protein C8R44DRAFT_863405 [Mycena epipterygia]|nr:hypothetical protein C8R44DRAFT_863405 [Mycena epipterygia]
MLDAYVVTMLPPTFYFDHLALPPTSPDCDREDNRFLCDGALYAILFSPLLYRRPPPAANAARSLAISLIMTEEWECRYPSDGRSLYFALCANKTAPLPVVLDIGVLLSPACHSHRYRPWVADSSRDFVNQRAMGPIRPSRPKAGASLSPRAYPQMGLPLSTRVHPKFSPNHATHFTRIAVAEDKGNA